MTRWTTFGSAPAPSQMEAIVWRRSCTRIVGRPINATGKYGTLEPQTGTGHCNPATHTESR